MGQVAGEDAAVLLGGLGKSEGLVQPLNFVFLLPILGPVGLELFLKFVALLPAAHLAGAQQQPLLPGVQGLGQLLDGGEQLVAQKPSQPHDDHHAQPQGKQVHPPQLLSCLQPGTAPRPVDQKSLVCGSHAQHQQVGPGPQGEGAPLLDIVWAYGLHQLGQAVIFGSTVGERGGFRGGTQVEVGGVEGDGLGVWGQSVRVLVHIAPVRPQGRKVKLLDRDGGELVPLQHPFQAQGVGELEFCVPLQEKGNVVGEMVRVQGGPGVAARGLYPRLVLLLGERLKGKKGLPAAPQAGSLGVKERGSELHIQGAPATHPAPGQGGLGQSLIGLGAILGERGLCLPLSKYGGEQSHAEKPGHQHHQAQKPGEGGPGTGTAFFGVCHGHPSNR